MGGVIFVISVLAVLAIPTVEGEFCPDLVKEGRSEESSAVARKWVTRWKAGAGLVQASSGIKLGSQSVKTLFIYECQMISG